MDDGQQTVILGPEGCGKTTLLKTLMVPDYRMEQLKKGIIIADIVTFSLDNPPEKVYILLYNALLRALDTSKDSDEKAHTAFNKLTSSDSTAAHQPAITLIPETIFTSAVSEVSKNFRIVFPLDNFELFTSSSRVTSEHHSVLRSVITLAQYIVVTNYDLNNDSLPRGIWGSLFLMDFANKELTIHGFTREETQNYLKEKLQGSPVQFSDALISKLYNASGGIPALLDRSAAIAFEHLKKGVPEAEFSLWKHFQEDKVGFHLLDKWGAVLSHQQIDLLHALATDTYAGGMIPSELQTAAPCFR